MNPDIERMIREAEAKGLTRNPTLILDARPGESPAETIARMQRSTEFVSGEEPTVPDQIADTLTALRAAGVPEPDCIIAEDAE